ncbi:MAG: hypothetical protein ACKN92_01075 [Candidatus Nanopelagicaceae bacterium]
MKYLRFLIPLSLLSLAYNVVILFSVVLNLDWVRTRAAGGQYETFPFSLRFIYFVMTVFMIFLALLLWNHREVPMDPSGPRTARIIGYTFFISTFFQLISRSTDERWNAIPALILAVTFILLSRREKSRQQ